MSDTLTCPNCGKTIRAETRFCPACGKPITTQTPAAPEPAVAAENKPQQVATPLGSPKTSRSGGPRLVIREGTEPQREVPLGVDTLIIGRDPNATIPIGLPSQSNPVGMPDISRRHAQITPQDKGYALTDLGSKNGTRLRGRELAADTPERLQHGDIIRIGDPYGNSVSLTYEEIPGAAVLPEMITISEEQLANLERMTIGRDPQSSLPLDSPLVSWHHAELARSDGGIQITDLGSTNGTFINGKAVQRAILKQGDQVQIGPYKLSYQPGALVAAVRQVRLDGIKLRKTVSTNKGSKVLLNDISLTILPREFVVLVGGSGAGKSTLIDALNGSRRAQEGQVLINGNNLYRNYDAYRGDIGYVPQSDIIHTALPVRKALMYTAKLRLPPDTSQSEIERRIDDVLQMVNMTPQKDVMISSLSGGQRKRVSIASEMLSDPNLLFLDEPTSGLDPGLDKKMMRTLNDLADTGRTILLTTHATSNILGACDHVLFLSHGRLVYFGPPQAALNFFQAADFSTIYAKLETPQQAEKEADRFEQSDEYHDYIQKRQQELPQPEAGTAPRQKRKRLTRQAWLRQLFILSRRYLDLILNDRFSLFVLLAVMPIIAVFLVLTMNRMSLVGDSERVIREIVRAEGSYAIAPDAQRLILMMALSAVLLGVFAAAFEIVKERPVYQRERMINLSIPAYLGSKLVVLSAFGIVQCLALLAVIAIKVQFPKQGIIMAPFLEMYITLVLALVSGIATGLFISSLVKSSNTVIYLVLLMLFVQMIFSGALFPLPDAINQLSALTSTRWTVEALGSTVNMSRLNDLGQVFIKTLDTTIGTRMVFRISYAATPAHLWQTWGILLGFTVVFLVATAIVLKRQDRH
ncbi:MAG: FHA domain-containing protein [Anaerolineae bacterium]|nr:FHA domain-containing protein [Anaerolineae bacterium]